MREKMRQKAENIPIPQWVNLLSLLQTQARQKSHLKTSSGVNILQIKSPKMTINIKIVPCQIFINYFNFPNQLFTP